MMIQKETIQIIASLLMKNAGKVNMTGLDNGKAGLSLSLFMAAEYLHDEKMEDIAHQLLMESLIIPNADAGFENGLSGIGYAMLLLMDKKYLEADFDDVFGKQYEIIIRILEKIENVSNSFLYYFQTVYFLSKIERVKKGDKRVKDIIRKLIEGIEWLLTVQFHDFENINFSRKKLDILCLYNAWLKLVSYSGYSNFSHSLIDIYGSLYQKGCIINSLEMGYYLKKIAFKYNIDRHDCIINENIRNGVKNIRLDRLSLRERIDIAKILSDLNYRDFHEHQLLPEINALHTDKGLLDLIVATPETFSPLGYGAGIGRLLIYFVDKQTELL